MENKINTSAENPSGQQTVHKRRVRYSGTHPRSYKEKYKELNPEKYGDTIEKVISKGGTPAGIVVFSSAARSLYTMPEGLPGPRSAHRTADS